MKVLVLNAGSSSLKYQLIDVEAQKVLAKGICERVGSIDSFYKHSFKSNDEVFSAVLNNHEAAVTLILHALVEGENPILHSLDEIDAVGHRVVQGGKYFSHSVLIDDYVKAKIDELAELAPLHNKAALQGIETCERLMPNTPNVAVFDSAFFQTLPPKAYMYALPYDLCVKYSIRKYGAHGTSHRYISQRAAVLMGEPLDDLKLITCHLGNGCSMSAIDHGVAVDTSMGMTPLDGLMMGSRCGSVDPAIVPFIQRRENMSWSDVDNVLNRQSGILGVSGISNDLRKVKAARDKGDERAQLAYDMFSNSVKKHIGQYMAVMGGVDAIVISAGIGENDPLMRSMIFQGLQTLGIVLDEERNKSGSGERYISTDSSRVKILIIPTDEEYMVARDTYDIVHG